MSLGTNAEHVGLMGNGINGDLFSSIGQPLAKKKKKKERKKKEDPIPNWLVQRPQMVS